MNSSRTESDSPDVCLLLEGTYPYVRGGVSTWVHQLISALPEVTFSIVFIGSEKKLASEAKYEIPPNVHSLEEIFLFGPPLNAGKRKRAGSIENAISALRKLLLFGDSDASEEEKRDALIGECVSAFTDLASAGVSFDRLWQSAPIWDLLTDFYRERFADEAFIEFFWNVRFLAEPLWKLLGGFDRIPPARIYHSASTGYAGFLGALAARRHRAPLVLSEHGIYVRERIAELLRAEWTPPDPAKANTATSEIPPLRRLWIDFFVEMGRFSYEAASTIVSLFRKNAGFQIEFGAPPERVRVIPNGISLDRFEPARKKRRELRIVDPDRKRVGFLGRIVAIKDVRTLLRAARLTVDAIPRVEFVLVGPTDEEPDYFSQCLQLAGDLGLTEKNVRFTGPAEPEKALPEFDLMVLSSASEGLPFAVLEALCAEMPVVSTDVGSCPELIEGRDDETPSLGLAGRVVPAGDPVSLAEALKEMLGDRGIQDRCAAAGRKRVERYYTEESVMSQYREIYRKLAAPVELPAETSAV